MSEVSYFRFKDEHPAILNAVTVSKWVLPFGNSCRYSVSTCYTLCLLPWGQPVILNDDVLVFFAQVSFDASARFGGSRYTEANIALLESYYIITNLRYSMTSLFTLSTVPIGERDTLESQRYYYGVYEWRVTTTCHCFGHSDTCVPAPGDTNGVSTPPDC